MRWYGLRLKMERTTTVARMWRLLWEASVAGEQGDDGNAVFLAQEAPDFVTLYFPPCAQLLARSVGAMRCAKPRSDGLTLLAGSEHAWQFHFSDESCVPLQQAAA